MKGYKDKMGKLFKDTSVIEEPFKLPEGWKWVRLEEIVNPRREIVESSEFDLYDVYVGLEHISPDSIKLLTYTSPREVKSSKSKFCKGDILYGKLRPYLNKVVVSCENGICSTDILVLVPNKDVYSKYVAFFMKSNFFLDKATRTMSGTNLPRTSWTKIKNFLIPLPFKDGKPDLEKQKQIVDKIESLFSRIDRAMELRRKALEETKQLFNSVLNKIFREAEENKEGWRWVMLSDLLDKKNKYSLGKVKKKDYKPFGKYPIVDQGEKFIAGYYDDDSLVYKGDLPVIVLGDHTLNLKYIDFPFIQGADGLKIIVPKKNIVYPKYLYHVLSWTKPKTKRYSRHWKIIKNIYLPIPLKNGKPDLQKQKEIAEYLDRLHEKIKRLEELQQKQLEKFKELKESILNKAFRGELV